MTPPYRDRLILKKDFSDYIRVKLLYIYIGIAPTVVYTELLPYFGNIERFELKTRNALTGLYLVIECQLSKPLEILLIYSKSFNFNLVKKSVYE